MKRSARYGSQRQRFFIMRLCCAIAVNAAVALVTFSQQPPLSEQPVAKIGTTSVITQKEFLVRYEFSPSFQRHIAAKTEENKQVFLVSLIAEKLLAAEARHQGIPASSQFQTAIKEVERLLVRDELYQQQIREKVNISEPEIQKALALSRVRLKVLMVYAAGKEEADFLERQIAAGTKLEDVSFEADSTKSFAGPDTLDVRWGEGNPTVEDVCLHLNIAQTSKPTAFDDGYYLFEIISKTAVSSEGEEETKSERQRVERVLRQRKEDERTFEFMSRVLRGKKSEANRELFKRILAAMGALSKSHVAGVGQDKIVLTEASLDALRGNLSSLWNEPFVIFPHKQWTVGETLERLRDSGFGIEQPIERHARRALDERLRSVIFQDELTDEAYREHLQNAPDVRWKLSMWSDSYLAAFLKQRIADSLSVSLQDIAEYSNSMADDSSSIALVKVEQLVVDSLASARKLCEQLDHGVSFEDLAQAYSPRHDEGKGASDAVYIPLEEAGELQSEIMKLRVGEHSQPILTNKGYVIVLLEDRRFVSGSSKNPAIRSEGSVRQKILEPRTKYITDRFLGELADHYGVSIDQRLLASTSVTSHPAVFFRMLGFGGRMLAVPLLKIDADWLMYCGTKPTELP